MWLACNSLLLEAVMAAPPRARVASTAASAHTLMVAPHLWALRRRITQWLPSATAATSSLLEASAALM
jgi:hypothetical protein